jgi:hypothetical protein
VASPRAPGLTAAEAIRWVDYVDGDCAQMMHLGSYAEEPATIDAIHDCLVKSNRKVRALHHEIYLSDPNKTAPEKMKTMIRPPVA